MMAIGNMLDIAIINGLVIDPKTGMRKEQNVGIQEGKIARLGQGQYSAKQVIDAKGKAVTPGFIDIHMHEDRERLPDGRIVMNLAGAMARMGVTTVVGGNCGLFMADVEEYLGQYKKQGGPVNFLSFVGHCEIRDNVFNHDPHRPIGIEDRKKIKDRVARGMEEGAIGVSFGLQYSKGVSFDEVVEVTKVAGDYEGALMAIHYRDDAGNAIKYLNEVIDVQRESGVPVQISHIGGMAAYGQMEEALEMIETALREGRDLSVDCYPYTAFSSYLGSTIYEPGCVEGWFANYSDLEFKGGPLDGQRAQKETFQEVRAKYPDTLVVAHVLRDEEVTMALQHPSVMVASDGLLEKNTGHPRGAGTFPRVLGKYVREMNALSLEDALNKATRMPAERLGLSNKGTIREGADADVVVFNPQTVIDRATFDASVTPPEGIDYVITNGVVVAASGELTGKNPGRVLTRKGEYWASGKKA